MMGLACCVGLGELQCLQQGQPATDHQEHILTYFMAAQYLLTVMGEIPQCSAVLEMLALLFAFHLATIRASAKG